MPPPLPECASALRFRAAPSPRLASTTRAFYPPNRYSRTPRTAAPASPPRLLTSWLFLTYPVASELQRGWLCSREMLSPESPRLPPESPHLCLLLLGCWGLSDLESQMGGSPFEIVNLS